MYRVIKGFGGQISGRKDEIIDLKDKKLINQLLEVGYIVEENTKNQSNTELKKEIEKLTNEVNTLKKEKEDLEIKLSEIELTNKPDNDQTEDEIKNNEQDKKTE